MTTENTKMEMRITEIPDCYVNLDIDMGAPLGASSVGIFDNERLVFFAETIFPAWKKHQWSLHQLDHYLEQYGIEIWSHDEKIPEDTALPEEYFSFWLRFTRQYPGDILVQCQRLSQQKVN
ncbi:hypothetical protein [Rodentibacter haemolyticus]|uniref:Uncharacterized protein n=1 Tax=Rodentibacter haemolyticus TaxID=2778911 RepID=A0ABX6V0I3_9PAST|nr:hypothetical protein [Rodentibacter haemolyticus]QPB42856.1 hypothetical protein IHV77_01650 [Rodentibacter haemolyticus]